MAWATATFDDVLDDLSSRFIINVPDEELASVERICFQIEQAHWFYEDFVREQNPALPSFNLKNFCAKFFQHCPLLHEWSNEHETAFANFMEYKIRVPVCGAIILNDAMDKCILVKGWTARSGWGFPKGKINKDEPDTLCAVREVWEETGYDVADKIRDEDYVEQTIKDQRIRLYIIKGVSEDTIFEPQTRKEISKIEWHYIAELPTSRPKPMEKGTQSGKESGTERTMGGPKGASRYYMVTPFVHKLKSWIVAQRRSTKRNKGQNAHGMNSHTQGAENHASRHPNNNHHHHHHQNQAGVPVISSTEAHLDSQVLKNMLGIGKSPQDSVSSAQRYPGSSQDLSPPLNDSRNSSESLKALLGIQSPNSGNVSSNNNFFAREGMVTGSPTIQPAPGSYSTRPVSTPSNSSSVPYQNGSEALKAILGIPSQPNSPASRYNHIANGASPVVSNSGAIPNGQGQQKPDFSPQVHHSSAASSPMHTRNGSVDLLALLKGGNGNGAGNGLVNGDGVLYKNNNNFNRINGRRNSGLGNGVPVKPKSNMTNFTFDMEALY